MHWPAEAGFWIARSFEYFPRGSVHLAVVDPGVGTARDIVIVEAEGHLLLAPDNGLLAPVVARRPGRSSAVSTRRSSARSGWAGSAQPFTGATSLRPSPPNWPPAAAGPRSSDR